MDHLKPRALFGESAAGQSSKNPAASGALPSARPPGTFPGILSILPPPCLRCVPVQPAGAAGHGDLMAGIPPMVVLAVPALDNKIGGSTPVRSFPGRVGYACRMPRHSIQ